MSVMYLSYSGFKKCSVADKEDEGKEVFFLSGRTFANRYLLPRTLVTVQREGQEIQVPIESVDSEKDRIQDSKIKLVKKPLNTGCLYEYWHVYVNETPHSLPNDRLGAIYGIVVGKIFEIFYNERLWRTRNTRQVLSDRVEGEISRALEEAVKPSKGRPGGVIRWRGEGEGQNPRGLYVDRQELMEDVLCGIEVGLDSIKKNLLVGRDAVAELKLDTTIGGHRIGGRADFIMTRVQHRDRIIVDGKGTKKRGDYTDPLQLLWYAMLYREKEGRLPDSTAFLYWKFEHPISMDWYTFTDEDADKLRQKFLRVVTAVERLTRRVGVGKKPSLEVIRNIFPPEPSISNCMFCPYAQEDVCPGGHAKRLEYETKVAARQG